MSQIVASVQPRQPARESSFIPFCRLAPLFAASLTARIFRRNHYVSVLLRGCNQLQASREDAYLPYGKKSILHRDDGEVNTT
jgi:hypothetical protein